MNEFLPILKKFGIAVGAILIVLLFIGVNRRVGELTRLQHELSQVSATAVVVEATQHQLQTQVAYATSPAAVEAWAGEDAHWIRPGQVLILPLSGESVPSTTPVVVSPTPTPAPSWWSWYTLFFEPLSDGSR